MCKTLNEMTRCDAFSVKGHYISKPYRVHSHWTRHDASLYSIPFRHDAWRAVTRSVWMNPKIFLSWRMTRSVCMKPYTPKRKLPLLNRLVKKGVQFGKNRGCILVKMGTLWIQRVHNKHYFLHWSSKAVVCVALVPNIFFAIQLYYTW
jgi:hypothetical protein